MFSWTQFVAVWNAFFFASEPVATLSVCRVLVGLLVFIDGCLLWPYRKILIGPDAVLTAAGFSKVYGKSRFTLFNLLPETQRSVDIVLALYLLSGLLVAAGVGTPYCFVVAWVLVVSVHHRGMYFMSGGDSLLRIILFLLCFSQAGVGLSVDAWLAGRGLIESMRTPVSPWCTRLLQIQIAMVYFRAFACKMQGPAWRNGTAVLYALSNKNYQPSPIPPWLRNRFAMAWATYATLMAEFALGILIWIRELRHPLVVMGLLMHLGMEYALNLQLFSWLMCVGLVSFVDPQWVISQLSVVSGPLSADSVAIQQPVVHTIVDTVPGYGLVNVFIVMYLFYCYIWSAPDNSPFKPFVKLIRPAVRYLGLWHSWSMFAPTLFSVTRCLELHVQFEDGGATVWTPDYSPKMTRWQRFRRERFRKLSENCREGEFSYVRWCLCEYVIRQYRQESGAGRQIKEVLIYHVEEPIVDFQTKPDADLSLKRHLHYTYVVK